jgi:hypothetical protein
MGTGSVRVVPNRPKLAQSGGLAYHPPISPASKMEPRPMRPFKPNLLLPLCALLLLSACNPIRESGRDRSLQATLKAFESTVRWGELASIQTFLKDDLQPKEGKAPKYDNVRITAYRVVQPGVMLDDGSVAISKAQISYVLKDRQVERNLIDEQHWEFQEEAGEWRRSNPLPKFN